MQRQRRLEKRLHRVEKTLAVWEERKPDPDKPEVHAAQLARAQAQVGQAQEVLHAFLSREVAESTEPPPNFQTPARERSERLRAERKQGKRSE